MQLWIWPASASKDGGRGKAKGPRRWRLAYRFGGKQKTLSPGAYPLVSLKDARGKRGDAKRMLAAGVDPSAEKKRMIAEGRASDNTFRAMAEGYLAKRTREGRRAATLTKLQWLLAFAYPTLGRRKIKDITAPVAILTALRPFTGAGRFVFPSVRTSEKPLSETTLNAALRRLGYGSDEATAHGFRASASTLLNESGMWSADAIERELAHVEANAIRRAYSRGEYWDVRVKMMAWWADHLDQLKSIGIVVPIELKSA